MKEKEKGVYSCVTLSDIHFGAQDPEKLYNELKEGVLKYIYELPVIDLVTINGDFYDSKISLDSKHAKFSMLFMKVLLELSRDKKFKVRMIKGTKSHDNDQLKVLEMINKDNIYDFRIIYTIESELLFPDLKVLYIPEEYVEDADVFYKPYIENKNYDLIFFHGMIAEAMYIGKHQESEVTMTKAPVFELTYLTDACYGPVMAGHIHTPMNIGEKFYYTGSYSNWMFGDGENEKGFYHLLYTPIDKTYEMTFIQNKLASKYETITLDVDNIKEDIKRVTDLLFLLENTAREERNVDYLRFKITIPDDYSNTQLLINTCKEMYARNKNVKLVFNNVNRTKQEKEIKEKINLLMDKYGFIFDKTISYENKIMLFIKEKYNRDISEEFIRSLIYDTIKK